MICILRSCENLYVVWRLFGLPQLFHESCSTTAVPRQMFPTAVPRQMFHDRCSTTAVPQQLLWVYSSSFTADIVSRNMFQSSCCSVTSVPWHLLHEICYMTSVPWYLFHYTTNSMHNTWCPTLAQISMHVTYDAQCQIKIWDFPGWKILISPLNTSDKLCFFSLIIEMANMMMILQH